MNDPCKGCLVFPECPKKCKKAETYRRWVQREKKEAIKQYMQHKFDRCVDAKDLEIGQPPKWDTDDGRPVYRWFMDMLKQQSEEQDNKKKEDK